MKSRAYERGLRDERERCIKIVERHLVFWQRSMVTVAYVFPETIVKECENILAEIDIEKSSGMGQGKDHSGF